MGLQLIPYPEAFRAAQSLPGHGEKQLVAMIVKMFDAPDASGLRLKKLAGHDKLHSARLGRSVRALLYREGSTYHLVHIGKRDSVYEWADRRRIEPDPDAVQVRILELPTDEGDPAEPSPSPRQPHPSNRKDEENYQPPLFEHAEDDYLLSLGLPEDWLPTIRQIRTVDELLDVVDRLDSWLAEALYRVAQGERVTPPRRRGKFRHREQHIVDFVDKPLSAWMVFLHEDQEEIARSSFDGPLRVTGSAGTGKTATALHRARHLVQEGREVLVSSFGRTLCDDLRELLGHLCTEEELSRIEVATVHAVALRMVREVEPEAGPVDDHEVEKLIEQVAADRGSSREPDWLHSEWQKVIQPLGIDTLEGYLEAPREGRGTALTPEEREEVWAVLGSVREELRDRQVYDWPDLARRARELLEAGEVEAPWDAVVVDEAQDLRTQEVRLVHAIGGDGPDGLSLFGDAGQRIYQEGFSLADLGVDVGDRTFSLTTSYRMTHQIRRFADEILASGNHGDDDRGPLRRTTRSLVDGPEPTVREFEDLDGQVAHVLDVVRHQVDQGVGLDEMAIFARSHGRLEPFREALDNKGYETHLLSPTEGRTAAAGVKLATMHRAKGLEFKVVFVVQVDADAIPNRTTLESQADPADREDARRRERKLLYVACTRARDELHVMWSGEGSPFLRASPG